MPLRFGTDGLRGVANTELTAELAVALGRAAALHLVGDAFIVGSDTRQSSAMLKAALSAGIASEGKRVIDVGVLPTPGVAFLAAAHGVPGAIISASHNPYVDNGIKLVSPSGTKIDDATERAIEASLDAMVHGAPLVIAPGGGGDITMSSTLVELYINHLLNSAILPSGKSLKVVCDCANGAAGAIAEEVLQRFGVDAEIICNEPNGTNINADCGSTHPERVIDAVRKSGADLGISLDGDADRLVAVAHDGTVIDGDQLLALFAIDLAARGELQNNGIVVTVMSNLGLKRRLETEGIAVVETPVGDRYVADALSVANYVLGGEQSGHIIFRRVATTGDGLLTGLKLLELVARSQKSLAELAAASMTRFPQELRTIYVSDPARLDEAAVIWSEVDAISAKLATSGRVLLRRSGTESAVRIMVEAEHQDVVSEIVERLVVLVQRELGAPKAELS